MSETLGLIGAGNLGEALLKGIGSRFGEIAVVERDATRAQQVASAYPVVTLALDALIARAETLIVAVKPRDLDGCLKAIATHLRPEQLVISVAAGVPCARLAAHIPLTQLIRVMPNTPAAVGQAVSAVFHPTGDPTQLARAQAIFSCVGDVVIVSNEAWFDAITALSGSGPAYVCLVLEAMIEGGVRAGLPRETAQRLALGTLRGTAHLIGAWDGDAVAVRHAVTSPGGTTAEGLAVLERYRVRSAFIEAIAAAKARSEELGKSE